MPEGYRHLTHPGRCQIHATGKSGLSGPAVAVLADQHLGWRVPAPFCKGTQPLHGLRERGALRHHVIIGRAFEDMARLAFQGAVVARGARLEAVHHAVIEPSYIDRRHGFAPKHRLSNCYHPVAGYASPSEPRPADIRRLPRPRADSGGRRRVRHRVRGPGARATEGHPVSTKIDRNWRGTLLNDDLDRLSRTLS